MSSAEKTKTEPEAHEATKTISVQVPVDLLAALDDRAKKDRRSRSAAAVVLIEDGLRRLVAS